MELQNVYNKATSNSHNNINSTYINIHLPHCTNATFTYIVKGRALSLVRPRKRPKTSLIEEEGVMLILRKHLFYHVAAAAKFSAPLVAIQKFFYNTCVRLALVGIKVVQHSHQSPVSHSFTRVVV